MSDWSDQLQVAERLLQNSDAKGAFREAFGALETCYRSEANLGTGTGSDRFSSACRQLFDKRRITQLEFDQARHLNDARNVVLHGRGFEPSLNEAQKSIAEIRRLCARFGQSVSDVMSTPVLRAKVAEPVGQYVTDMREKGITYFPVVDDEDCVIGTLDEWALIDAMHQEEGLVDLSQPVRTYMSDKVLPEVAANATLDEAIRKLRHHKTSALLILAARRPTGIVTAFDLLR